MKDAKKHRHRLLKTQAVPYGSFHFLVGVQFKVRIVKRSTQIRLDLKKKASCWSLMWGWCHTTQHNCWRRAGEGLYLHQQSQRWSLKDSTDQVASHNHTACQLMPMDTCKVEAFFPT
jgi:hypothetical protein